MLGLTGKAFHHLPCKIDHNGDAKVSNFFIVDQETEEQAAAKSTSYFKSTLRGRGLQGCEMDLENRFGYSAIAIKKNDGRWELDEKADTFTVWCHDQRPSYLNSITMSAPGWIELANSIHKD
jgi:ribonuclease H2 subunit C